MRRELLEANLSNNQAMSLYLDPTLSPEDEHHDVQRRAFKAAQWSPLVLGATECLLATLQHDHNLRIHRFVQQEWKVHVDNNNLFNVGHLCVSHHITTILKKT